MRKKYVAVVLFVIMVLCAASMAGAKEKVYNWKFQAHMTNKAATTGKNLDRFIEMIDKNTNGRVKIERHSVDSITGRMEMLDAAGMGVLQAFVAVGGYWQGTVPIGMIENGLPQSWRNINEIEEILWDYGLEELARKEYAKHGVYLLTNYAAAPALLSFHMRKPVQGLDDLKGKKIRGFGPILQLIKKLGGSPISLSLAEVYSALATGALDGTYLAALWSGPNKISEVAPYFLWPPVDVGGTHHIMLSMDAWKKLPDDLQSIVYLTAKDWAHWNNRYYAARNLPDRAQLEKWGFKVIDMPKDYQDGLTKVSMELWEEQAQKDQACAEAVQLLKTYFKETGRPGF